MEVTLSGLRVLRAVAEQGSFTAAAQSLGYTQSAVSRQIAALEAGVGAQLVTRDRGGARLTSPGSVLLRHATVALTAVADAAAELSGASPAVGRVRIGVTPLAAALLLPGAVGALRRRHPQVDLTSRDSTTPALLRALRAGTLDAAVLTSRPPHRHPDSESPRLRVEPLLETKLVLAVPSHGVFAGRDTVALDELRDVSWIASSGTSEEPLLGSWPGLPGRPRIAHSTRDWLVKLQLVAAGAGVTTVPASIAPLLPGGAQLVRVTGAPEEVRRISIARLPAASPAALQDVLTVLRDQAARLSDRAG
ncbi:MAG TPA: LysR family transcriptional regulator [Jatrophihabitans sp.]|nr:LysR family transcriptional regulator [Jatrophihabitans sp.]